MNSPLSDLINEWLRGDISAERLAELERHLRADPAARRELRRAANLDSALRDRASQDNKLAAWLAHEKSQRPAGRSGAALFLTPKYLTLALAAAALLVLAAIYLPSYPSASANGVAAAPAVEQMDRGVAVLAQAVDAQWEGEIATARLGDTLRPGAIRLGGG